MPRKHIPGDSYVQVMYMECRYGGPEEGGWWYTHCRNILPFHKLPTGSAMNLAKKLSRRHKARLHIQHKSEWPFDRDGRHVTETIVWVGKNKHHEQNPNGAKYE